MEKNEQNEWNWNKKHFLDFEEESYSSTFFKNDIIMIADDYTETKEYYVKFYDAATFDLIKEVRWNLFTDEKTVIEK